MFHTVLVPLDGSWFSEAALPLAAGVAKAAGAKLNLLMVHQRVEVTFGMGDPLIASPEVEMELLSDQAYLAASATWLAESGGIPVEFHENDGTPGPEICEEAARIDADLVIMSTHGRGGLRRLWLGGVADYVVRHMATPVLLVHPNRVGMGDRPLPRNILVALDLSSHSEAILEPAVSLARATGATLTLVHVTELSNAIPIPAGQSPVLANGDLAKAARTGILERLDRIARRLQDLGVRAEITTVVGSNAADTLLSLLAEDGFDMIAMTTQGRGGMSRVLLGSVADRVIRGATKPVLVLRPLLAVASR